MQIGIFQRNLNNFLLKFVTSNKYKLFIAYLSLIGSQQNNYNRIKAFQSNQRRNNQLKRLEYLTMQITYLSTI
jgi:hypothetical protein